MHFFQIRSFFGTRNGGRALNYAIECNDSARHSYDSVAINMLCAIQQKHAILFSGETHVRRGDSNTAPKHWRIQVCVCGVI